MRPCLREPRLIGTVEVKIRRNAHKVPTDTISTMGSEIDAYTAGVDVQPAVCGIARSGQKAPRASTAGARSRM